MWMVSVARSDAIKCTGPELHCADGVFQEVLIIMANFCRNMAPIGTGATHKWDCTARVLIDS